jgi:(p)ppGpp synthase/HD superfamily hydrolase
MKYFPDILRAAIFAAEAHKDQRRKYTNEPYVNHCINVASRVESIGGSSQMIIAALLHDTIEDCNITHSDICQLFGYHVADLVLQVTDISRPSDGNRAERKRRDREHLKLASPQAKTIKLADLLDNTESITAHDPKFAKTYMKEKALLLPYLTDGNELLYNQALAAIKRYDDGQKTQAL